MATRSASDHIRYTDIDNAGSGEYTITLHDTSVRRVRKNEYISFVEPLLANPQSSMYNLKRIKTVFSVKAWVEHSALDPDGFSGNTLDALLVEINAEDVEFKWRDNTFNGFIKTLNVVEKPGEYIGDYTFIEFEFEVGTDL